MYIFDKIKNSLVIKMWLFEIAALSLILSVVFFAQQNSLKVDYYTALGKTLQKDIEKDLDIIEEQYGTRYANSYEKIEPELHYICDEHDCDILILDENYSIVYRDFEEEILKELSLKNRFYINQKIVNVENKTLMPPFYESFIKSFERDEDIQVIFDFNTDKVSYLSAFNHEFGNKTYYIIAYVHKHVGPSIISVYDDYIVRIYLLVLLSVTIISYFTNVYFVRPLHKIEHALKNFRTKDALTDLPFKRTDELGSVSRSIQMLNTQLENADGLHKEVFSNISHELKTPIVLIAGYSEMVRDISWQDDKKRNEHLNLVIKEANRMTNMVNEILDYSQVANGYVTLTLDYTNLHKILLSEQNSAQATAIHYKLNVDYVCEIDRELKVLIDSLRISQVMRNLLNNAINHSSEDATIYIRSRMVDDGIKISVENKGEKIPDVDKGLIFNRYFRAQHQNSRREGSGIGLSIVRSIYEAHGFTYGIDHIKGYNVFYFVIQSERIGKN